MSRHKNEMIYDAKRVFEAKTVKEDITEIQFLEHGKNDGYIVPENIKISLSRVVDSIYNWTLWELNTILG